jgi:hypothetical protein
MTYSDWDPQHPPEEAPAGADPLFWRLAFGLFRDHRPDIDDRCVTCRAGWPCGPRRLADEGFAKAMGQYPPAGGRRHEESGDSDIHRPAHGSAQPESGGSHRSAAPDEPDPRRG